MRKSKKTIPVFKTEKAEREFWSGTDSTAFVDWSKASRVRMVNLRPTLRPISIRLPVLMIEKLKVLANKRDVSYQSLIKLYLAQCIDKELTHK